MVEEKRGGAGCLPPTMSLVCPCLCVWRKPCVWRGPKSMCGQSERGQGLPVCLPSLPSRIQAGPGGNGNIMVAGTHSQVIHCHCLPFPSNTGIMGEIKPPCPCPIIVRSGGRCMRREFEASLLHTGVQAKMRCVCSA